MRRLFLICAMPLLLGADDHWVKFTRGPFEVFTDAGSHAGREAMVRFEQFRNALGQILGESDLQPAQPVRIFVFKNPRGWTSTTPIGEGRDRYTIVLAEKAGISPALNAALVRLFLKSTTQMPPAFENGLVAFFSTLTVNGIRPIVGAPPAKPDLDWARIHLMVCDPEYFGKVRVLLYNLRRGVAEDPAYRNAFGKSAAEVEAQAKQHLAAGNFQTTTLSPAAMAESDFPERPVSDTDIRLARADLLAGAQSAAEYQKLLQGHEKVPESEEGLALLALSEGRKEDAHRYFGDAIEADSTSARCYIEYAKLEGDTVKATQALLKAAGINPKLDEPFAIMAQRDTDARMRAMHWKAAAERNPRNAAYWKSAAEAWLALHNYAEAAKAWSSGEQAATDPAVRNQMHQARLAIEQQRLDYEEAERRREAEEQARDIAKLKAQAQAELHKAEAKMNEGSKAPADKPVPWWDGPQPSGKVAGTLKQVDCLPRQQARLIIESTDHKTVRLLIADPAKVAFAGAGQATLGCGVQKARHVVIEYFPKPDSRLATAGEVATIEFQ
jgi:tetratricopeptide (TPR) repeat protein